jgi:transposase
MVAKCADHLPLYRQEKIFGRAGLPIARSMLAQWVGQGVFAERLHGRD